MVSDIIVRVFNRSGATPAVALDTSKGFHRVWHAGLLDKLKYSGISGQIFGLISSFLSNGWLEWFWMRSLHNSIQVMVEFLKAPFSVLHFSLYTLLTFLMMMLLSLLWLSYKAIYNLGSQSLPSYQKHRQTSAYKLMSWKVNQDKSNKKHKRKKTQTKKIFVKNGWIWIKDNQH